MGETLTAMKKIGKNKAPSVDGLMDIIFQKTECEYIDIDGWIPDHSHRIEMEMHKDSVYYRIAEKLTQYLNYCTHEQSTLLFD